MSVTRLPKGLATVKASDSMWGNWRNPITEPWRWTYIFDNFAPFTGFVDDATVTTTQGYMVSGSATTASCGVEEHGAAVGEHAIYIGTTGTAAQLTVVKPAAGGTTTGAAGVGSVGADISDPAKEIIIAARIYCTTDGADINEITWQLGWLSPATAALEASAIDGVCFYMTGAGALTFLIGTANGVGAAESISVGTVVDATWHDIGAHYSPGNGWRFYFDNVLAGESSQVPRYSTSLVVPRINVVPDVSAIQYLDLAYWCMAVEK